MSRRDVQRRSLTLAQRLRQEIGHRLPAAAVGVRLEAESLGLVERQVFGGEGMAGLTVGLDLPVDARPVSSLARPTNVSGAPGDRSSHGRLATSRSSAHWGRVGIIDAMEGHGTLDVRAGPREVEHAFAAKAESDRR